MFGCHLSAEQTKIISLMWFGSYWDELYNKLRLLPIIQGYILLGAMVMSDLWAAYDGIPSLPERYQQPLRQLC